MEEGLVVRGRVEIDSRQPFKSVKEAVMLFGENVLANQVYGNKLKEMKSVETKNDQDELAKVGPKEEKQAVEELKDERKLMAYYLMSLTQQLNETKSELDQLKSTRGSCPSHFNEIEEIKFIENPKPTQVKPSIEDERDRDCDRDRQHKDDLFDLKHNMSVMSHNPPSTKMIKKAKKRTILPSVGRLFSRSKG
ncbi:WEB family protein At2g17940-like [Rutidosis leptorrhynchoides]|uniref:WEB family protein At2g17940-like n=1 Tax=Rutidosis leptorrhynchoides TaxID=125765 RepID=UPI003A99B58A